MPDSDGVVTSVTGVACPRIAMLLVVVTVCTAACMGIGPGTVNRDRFEYTTAEFASGRTNAPGDIELTFDHTHAHLAHIHWSTHGVVR